MSRSNPSLPTFEVIEVIPHRGAMVLIDRILACNQLDITTEVAVKADALFAGPRGVPGWVGLEYMAQSIAALAGTRQRVEGRDIQIGFLVGSRRYQCQNPFFSLGSRLAVTARELIHGDNGLSVFECSIRADDPSAPPLASANVNVFQPADALQFIREELT